MQDMHYPRERSHGVVLLGQHILVVGGWDGKKVVTKTSKCESFDILKGAWKDLPDFDEFVNGVTLVSANIRYAIAFGGCNQHWKHTDRILRMDFQKLN
jgi:hypothetical protein